MPESTRVVIVRALQRRAAGLPDLPVSKSLVKKVNQKRRWPPSNTGIRTFERLQTSVLNRSQPQQADATAA